MKRIDVSKPRGPKRLTAIVVGVSRAGKTRFAATWPRPIFLSDASEHGWTTIEYMEDDEFYEAGHRPEVVAIETPQDMLAMYLEIEQRVKKDPNDIMTVVIDSLTFYADARFSALEAENPDAKDPRKLYGELHSHLRYLMIQFHKLPCNILWLALPKEGDGLGGVLVAGQTATKAPARCDLWLYLDKDEKQHGDNVLVNYAMYTQSHKGHKAGHRFGNRLSSVMDPEYTAIEEALAVERRIEPTAKPAPADPAKPSATGTRRRRTNRTRATAQNN